MLLPSHFASPSDQLEKLAADLDLEPRGNPYDLLCEVNENSMKFRLRTKQYRCGFTDRRCPAHPQRRLSGLRAHHDYAGAPNCKFPCRYVSGYLYHEDK